MMRRIAVAGLAMVLLGASPGGALAQSDEAPPEETARQRGVRLFQEAAAHYRAGRFRVAVELLRESHELHPEPVVLFNLARSLEGLGELDEALDAYARFLEAAPDAPDRGAVEARIQTLDRLVRERREAASDPAITPAPAAPLTPVLVPPPAPAPSGPDELDPPAIVLSVLGGAGLLAGAIVSGVAVTTHNEWVDAPSHADAVQSLAEAREIATAANVALGIGGALALVGGLWLIVDAADSGDDDTERASVRVGVSASGARLDVHW